MARALIVVALGILLGLLIVWMVMSQVPPDREPVDRFQAPASRPGR